MSSTPHVGVDMSAFIHLKLMPWVPQNLHTSTQVLHRYSALAPCWQQTAALRCWQDKLWCTPPLARRPYSLAYLVYSRSFTSTDPAGKLGSKLLKLQIIVSEKTQGTKKSSAIQKRYWNLYSFSDHMGNFPEMPLIVARIKILLWHLFDTKNWNLV